MDMEALKKRQEWSRDEPLSEMSDSAETLINHLVAIDTNSFDNNSNSIVLVADTQADAFQEKIRLIRDGINDVQIKKTTRTKTKKHKKQKKIKMQIIK